MKKIIALFFILIAPFMKANDQQSMIDALLDGLHQDAHEANFETYFARYSSDAVFLGTDKVSTLYPLLEMKSIRFPLCFLEIKVICLINEGFFGFLIIDYQRIAAEAHVYPAPKAAKIT